MIADLLAGIFTLVYVLLWAPETVAYPQAGVHGVLSVQEVRYGHGARGALTI